jgi:hypothetical protein
MQDPFRGPAIDTQVEEAQLPGSLMEWLVRQQRDR